VVVVPAGTFTSLKELRERLLGYRFESVVRLTGLDRDRLRAIEEQGAAPTVFETEVFARVYGVDADLLADEPIRLAPGDAVQLLASLDEFRVVDDMTRARIVAAANAARDLVRLRRMESSDDPRTRLLREMPRPPRPKRSLPPYRQGAQLAVSLRAKLGLGTRAIASLRDLVAQAFPSLGLLYADFGPDGPAGVSFVDQLRGPAVVLNLRGKNANPCVRRFSLAHEICHLLVDWTGQESLAVVSGYLTDSGLEREQRANAFAIRLLCPETALRHLSPRGAPVAAARKLLSEYGLSYAAARLHLRNQGGGELPAAPPPELVGIGTEPVWVQAEEPLGVGSFPLPAVPPERRTAVAQTAARLYSSGQIGRDQFAEEMGVTPMEDVERVLDFLALDAPQESPASVA
jgi:Zn-dependent peptidase ImmA (M78 family)